MSEQIFIRRQQLRKTLTEDRTGRRNCKISSRSSYPWGCHGEGCRCGLNPCNSFEKLRSAWFHVRLGAGLPGERMLDKEVQVAQKPDGGQNWKAELQDLVKI